MQDKRTLRGTIVKLLGFVLKIAIAAAVVWFFLFRNPDELAAGFAQLRWPVLVPAFMFYGAHIVFCSIRWRCLANMLGTRLSFWEACSLTFQGYFFSLVVPGGAVGGDVVKMGVVTRRLASGTKAEGAFTVFMDRIVGMIALFGMAIVMIPFAIDHLMKVEVPGLALDVRGRAIGIACLAALCLAGLVASAVIFFHRPLRKVKLVDRLFVFGDRVTGGMVSRLVDATDVYAKCWPVLGWLTLMSVVCVHLMTVAPVFFLLSGMGLEWSFFPVIVAVTIGNIVGLIPLFPSGVGGRDMAVVMLLVACGVPSPDAKAAMVVYSSILVLWSLAGGLFFVFDPGRKVRSKEVCDAK